MDVTCPNCGADNVEAARFCRKCGTPLGAAEFSEATTRSLEQRPETGAPRAPDTFGSSPIGTGDARYTPPVMSPESAAFRGYGQVPAPMGSAPMQPPPAKKSNWLLVVGVVLLVAVLGGVAIVAVVASKIKSAIDRSHVSVPSVSVPKGTPSAGPIDPDRLPAELRPWFYDGAEQTPVVNTMGKMSVLVMKTSDSVQEVSDFYQEKFDSMHASPRRVMTPDNVIFSAADIEPKVNVVVNRTDEVDPDDPEGRLTNIVVTLGAPVMGAPDIQIPEIPNIGHPEAPPAPPAEPGKAAPPPAPPAKRTP